MAIAHVRHVGSSSAKGTIGTSASITVPAAGCALGNVVIVRIALGDDANSPSVVDDRGNTYTAIHSSASIADMEAHLFASKLTTALVSGDTIDVSWTTEAGRRALAAEEFSGLEITEIATSAGAEGSGTTPSSGASGTPSAAVGLGFGMVAVRGPTGDAFTEDADTTGGTAWTSLTRVGTSGGSATTNAVNNAAYKVTTSAAAQTYNPTIDSRGWNAVVAVLQETSTGGATATPAVAAVTTTVPAATITRTAEKDATVIATSAVLPVATAALSDTVEPAVAALTSTVPQPTITYSATVTPAVIAMSAVVPAATPVLDDTAEPAVVAITTTVPAPTISVGGNVTAEPPVIATTAALAAATPTADDVAEPAVIATLATIPTVTYLTDWTVVATVVAATTALPAATPLADSAVTGVVIAVTSSVPAATPLADSAASPPVVALTTTVPAVTYLTDWTATPQVIACTVTVPAATVGAIAVVTPAVIVVFASPHLPTILLAGPWFFSPPTGEGDVAWRRQVGVTRALARHMEPGVRGRNVFLLTDGTVTRRGPDGHTVTWDDVARVFYGGHVAEEVTEAQKELLEAAGYTVEDRAYA
jgi:hypothetical protein